LSGALVHPIVPPRLPPGEIFSTFEVPPLPWLFCAARHLLKTFVFPRRSMPALPFTLIGPGDFPCSGSEVLLSFLPCRSAQGFSPRVCAKWTSRTFSTNRVLFFESLFRRRVFASGIPPGDKGTLMRPTDRSPCFYWACGFRLPLVSLLFSNVPCRPGRAFFFLISSSSEVWPR